MYCQVLYNTIYSIYNYKIVCIIQIERGYFMENNKKRNEYDRKYKKEHYKRIEILCKPADADLITDYCKDSGINSKSAYIVNCVKYCIDNNIDVM